MNIYSKSSINTIDWLRVFWTGANFAQEINNNGFHSRWFKEKSITTKFFENTWKTSIIITLCYFCKKLHVRCLRRFWVGFCSGKKNLDINLIAVFALGKNGLNWGRTVITQLTKFKAGNKNNRKRCEICLKLTIKTLERRPSGVFTFNFEHISHLFLVFLLLALNKQMSARNVKTRLL